MLRFLFALAALVLFSADAFAGPVRDFINNHRPGIIIPKRSNCAPAPQAKCASCGPTCACPQGVCPNCPVPQAMPAKVESGRVIVGYQCVGGKCYPVYSK